MYFSSLAQIKFIKTPLNSYELSLLINDFKSAVNLPAADELRKTATMQFREAEKILTEQQGDVKILSSLISKYLSEDKQEVTYTPTCRAPI